MRRVHLGFGVLSHVVEGILRPVMTPPSFLLAILLYGVLQMEAAVSKPELSDPIAIRIPLEVLAQIEAVAAATERTRSWVMVRALRYYLGAEGAEILAAIEGRRQIAEDVYDMDDVIAELDAIADGKAA